MKLCHKMLSHPSHLIEHSTTVLVVPPSFHNAKAPLGVEFGTTAAWDLPVTLWAVSVKSPGLHHTLKALRCAGTFETSLSYLTDSQLYLN